METRFEALAPDARRSLAMRATHEAIATDLLREREPESESLALLSICIVDAGLTGDRAALAVAAALLARLVSYLPAEAEWRELWVGRLSLLRVIALQSRARLITEWESAVPCAESRGTESDC
ncbi:MAG: hypothetical protein QOI31_1713 [Solirubrobacterales bacterium]|jgi:hypothetical protein|nr:hypothetical protein [Solirubrobacterales bacterium]